LQLQPELPAPMVDAAAAAAAATAATAATAAAAAAAAAASLGICDGRCTGHAGGGAARQAVAHGPEEAAPLHTPHGATPAAPALPRLFPVRRTDRRPEAEALAEPNTARRTARQRRRTRRAMLNTARRRELQRFRRSFDRLGRRGLARRQALIEPDALALAG
jgi:hypothetical protein